MVGAAVTVGVTAVTGRTRDGCGLGRGACDVTVGGGGSELGVTARDEDGVVGSSSVVTAVTVGSSGSLDCAASATAAVRAPAMPTAGSRTPHDDAAGGVAAGVTAGSGAIDDDHARSSPTVTVAAAAASGWRRRKRGRRARGGDGAAARRCRPPAR